MSALADAFLENRAEQLPLDVNESFIVPPFFGRISIFGDKKSVRILGGRGCGKTMFIRFFCHSTVFSKSHNQISDSTLDAVGLYFRPDTGFSALMTSEWLGSEQQAKMAFSHYVTLQLLLEFSAAVDSIDNAKFKDGEVDLSSVLLNPALQVYFSNEVKKIAHLKEYVEGEMVRFEMWVQNPRHETSPRMLSFGNVLSRIAEMIAAESGRLNNFSLRVFVDEFENLMEMQRTIICDVIKHPANRFIVHIAHKRDAVTDFKTSSGERIALIHDLRVIDLEEELSKNISDFELLAAELVLLRLHRQGFKFNCEVFDVSKLNDIEQLNGRLNEDYRVKVVGTVRSILPALTSREIANIVMEDPPLLRRLKDMIDKGLSISKLEKKYQAETLINISKPEASIVLGALLNRRTLNAESVISSYIQAVKSDNDPFYKSGGWVDNNLYGCLFHLYAGLPRRANLLYAGFDRFCRLANPNLRFFQELCHITLLLAFERKNAEDIQGQLIVEHDIQAQAVRQVSDSLFQGINQLGLQGQKLLEVVLRLGQLFEAFNRRRSQSESEINHFSIDEADRSRLSNASIQILKEAKVWSVLYEEKETKNKGDYDVAQSDWILNQIYCPHFNISYRKRKKVTLKAGQVDTILSGSYAQFEAFLKSFVNSDEVDPKASCNNELF